MHKKLAAAVALLALCMLARAGFATAGAIALADDASVLSLFFNTDDFTPADDFFYRFALQAEYGPEQSHGKVREIRPFGGQYLFVVETRGDTHPAGYCNLAFGVYDPQMGGLVGEPLRFSADWADYTVCCRDGVLSVLYIGGSTWTGLESYGGGRWVWDGGVWRMAWPYEAYGDAYYDFWARRKPEIVHESPGTISTLWRVQAPEGEDLSDYVWQREGTFYTFYPVAPEYRHKRQE